MTFKWGKTTNNSDDMRSTKKLAQICEEHFGAKFPLRSRYNNYCRTLGFRHPEINNAVLWREAIELNNTWRISEITKIPDPENEGQSLHRRKPVSNKQNLTYAEMLWEMNEQEIFWESSFFKKTDEKPGKMAGIYGADGINCFRILANFDAIAFDKDGNPVPTIGGHIVGSGTFSPEEEENVRTRSSQLPTLPKREKDEFLKELFSGQANNAAQNNGVETSFNNMQKASKTIARAKKLAAFVNDINKAIRALKNYHDDKKHQSLDSHNRIFGVLGNLSLNDGTNVECSFSGGYKCRIIFSTGLGTSTGAGWTEAACKNIRTILKKARKNDFYAKPEIQQKINKFVQDAEIFASIYHCKTLFHMTVENTSLQKKALKHSIKIMEDYIESYAESPEEAQARIDVAHTAIKNPEPIPIPEGFKRFEKDMDAVIEEMTFALDQLKQRDALPPPKQPLSLPKPEV